MGKEDARPLLGFKEQIQTLKAFPGTSPTAPEASGDHARLKTTQSLIFKSSPTKGEAGSWDSVTALAAPRGPLSPCSTVP